MEMQILIWVVVGVIAGWLTGLLMKGRGYGLVGDLIIGLLGGIIGGWLFDLLGLVPTSWLGQILVSFVGGVVLVAVVRLLRRV
jgi:uncharacterized membrane protein YeaQ/YmgE (transglycosylase-associated protein family)